MTTDRNDLKITESDDGFHVLGSRFETYEEAKTFLRIIGVVDRQGARSEDPHIKRMDAGFSVLGCPFETYEAAERFVQIVYAVDGIESKPVEPPTIREDRDGFHVLERTFRTREDAHAFALVVETLSETKYGRDPVFDSTYTARTANLASSQHRQRSGTARWSGPPRKYFEKRNTLYVIWATGYLLPLFIFPFLFPYLDQHATVLAPLPEVVRSLAIVLLPMVAWLAIWAALGNALFWKCPVCRTRLGLAMPGTYDKILRSGRCPSCSATW